MLRSHRGRIFTKRVGCLSTMSVTDLLSSAHVLGILLGAVVPDPLLTQSTQLSRLGCMWMGFPSSPSSSLQSPESGNHPESKREKHTFVQVPAVSPQPHPRAEWGDGTPGVTHRAGLAHAQEDFMGYLGGHTDADLGHR